MKDGMSSRPLRYAFGLMLTQILDVASGMQYLHHNGVVHGGLRPNNILITDDKRVVLSEYGMFELQQSTRDPEAHRYLSPEAWKGVRMH